MDFQFSGANDGAELDSGSTAIVAPPMTYMDALAKVRRTIENDPVMIGTLIAAIGADRLREALTDKPFVQPFPDDIGTVECSIWDNQPFTKSKRSTGDNSRERPARFGVTLKAHAAGTAKPITTKPSFKSTGDLFTADQIRSRLKKAWKGIEAEDQARLESEILPLADARGFLIARLFTTAKGLGKHWHQGHFLLIDQTGLNDRDLNGAVLIVGDRLVQLAPFSKLDGTGDPFPIVERAVAGGSTKTSICVLQSRASDQSALQKSWSTGICE